MFKSQAFILVDFMKCCKRLSTEMLQIMQRFNSNVVVHKRVLTSRDAETLDPEPQTSYITQYHN